MPDAMPVATLAAPEAALALHLLDQARQAASPVVAILRSAPRLARVAALAHATADGVEVLALPPWDVLPYDRTLPSAAIVGQRMRALTALAQPARGPRLLLTSAAAALQRVRPARDLPPDRVLRCGDPLDPQALATLLAERGYHAEERVDEAGTVALRGQTVELFPAGAPCPVRLEVADGRIAAIYLFDPATLRSTGFAEQVALTPATEFPLDPAEVEDAAEQLAHPGAAPEAEDAGGDALAAPGLLPRLVPLFDLLPGAPVWTDPEVGDRWAAAHEQAQDAFAATQAARRANPAQGVLPRPARLFLTPAQAAAALTGPRLPPVPPTEAVPAPDRIADLVALAKAAAGTVVIAALADPARVAASLARRGLQAKAAADWAAAQTAGVHVLHMDLAEGARLRRQDGTPLLLIPAGTLLRMHRTARVLQSDNAPRLGDRVVHEDHGVAILTALREVDGEDRIALEFAEGAELLVPAWDLDRIWRLGGAEEAGPAPDRMGGESWRRRRAEVEAEVQAAAAGLAQAAQARAQARAPRIDPHPLAPSLARRFPHPLTPDQRAAIDATLSDMASGRPMDRLVCGDVGFGKTEVALRATAAAALAGVQVLVAAPTTVLARQHLEVFQRRFAGSGIEVVGLIRGASTAEGRSVRRSVAKGQAHVVVGTQGLAAEGMRFAGLGLAVIDEEQRFGEDDKRRLAGLAGARLISGGLVSGELAGVKGERPHLLTMTATPIPRTLQGALAGLRDVSVLTTPPQHRQPTRTFVLPWDPVVVREALLRERRRGGQSFIVVPRISDLTALQGELAGLVPELAVTPVHGRMAPEAAEAAIVGFAHGAGDVLLATNIIEAGLDIPRANLMIVMGADRFGLAQLHQLRGRVGRGARRGTAYFLTAATGEGGHRLSPIAVRRLHMLETLTGLGAGVEVAAADMGLRGAGDLFGDRQAGHVRAIGTELYQVLLARAVAANRGEAAPPPPPVVHAPLAGRIPEAEVPEPNLRLELLRRLSRLPDAAALHDFAEELADRFGPPLPELSALLDLARLRVACRQARVAHADLGPQGAALTPVDPGPFALVELAARLGGEVHGVRVVLHWTERDPAACVARVVGLLEG